MRKHALIMGMPILVEIAGAIEDDAVFDRVFTLFRGVDEQFSPFKPQSEVTRLNRRELDWDALSPEMHEVLALASETTRQTDGYFSVMHDGVFNPSGLVKGWAIHWAASLLSNEGRRDFYVDAGGDVAVAGRNEEGKAWRIGIRNPFEPDRIVKVLALTAGGVATSALYERGRHIYNPHQADDLLDQVASLTVVGENIFEADRFATAAFAMGRAGIDFIETRTACEGYQINSDGRAVMTSGLGAYVSKSEASS
ncbi:MAG: FAD:protein FMN transferase [Caldilineaceae bacterium]|nr:FAD:protein FMN transferase [Caldilineaceae bacterium]